MCRNSRYMDTQYVSYIIFIKSIWSIAYLFHTGKIRFVILLLNTIIILINLIIIYTNVLIKIHKPHSWGQNTWITKKRNGGWEHFQSYLISDLENYSRADLATSFKWMCMKYEQTFLSLEEECDHNCNQKRPLEMCDLTFMMCHINFCYYLHQKQFSLFNSKLGVLLMNYSS